MLDKEMKEELGEEAETSHKTEKKLEKEMKKELGEEAESAHKKHKKHGKKDTDAEDLEDKHHKLHQKNKEKNEKRKSHPKKEKHSDETDLVQKKKEIASEKAAEPYGAPNPKPSKYEKKLRSIFSEMKQCNYVALKNLERDGQVLTQTANGVAIGAKAGKELVDD